MTIISSITMVIISIITRLLNLVAVGAAVVVVAIVSSIGTVLAVSTLKLSSSSTDEKVTCHGYQCHALGRRPSQLQHLHRAPLLPEGDFTGLLRLDRQLLQELVPLRSCRWYPKSPTDSFQRRLVVMLQPSLSKASGLRWTLGFLGMV